MCLREETSHGTYSKDHALCEELLVGCIKELLKKKCCLYHVSVSN